MTRLILLLALLAGAWWLWQRRTRRQPALRPAETDSLPMVRCQYCGVHVPRDSAVSRNDQWYCCREHAERELPPKQP